jgi:photosystem II stability/assembly factor-like uncharacterized protein
MLNVNDVYAANDGTSWVLVGGPGTVPRLLACQRIGDPSQPQGDVSQTYVPRLDTHDEYQVANESQGPVGRVTFNVEAKVRGVGDWMSRTRCPLDFYVMMKKCGDRRVFSDYDRGEAFLFSLKTDQAASNLTSFDADDDAMRTYGYSAREWVSFFKLQMTRQATIEADDIAGGIAAVGPGSCQGDCGAYAEPCDHLFLGCSRTGAVSANVLESTNGGVTWAATAADPFAVSEDIKGLVAFAQDADTYRIIAGRGTTDAAAPAEIAWSDDYGATWTLVNVGTTNAEFITWGNAIAAIDKYHIWAGTEMGNLFFSEDGGATWADLNCPATVDIYAIHPLDENYVLVAGENNLILWSTDGGEHFAAITGPAARAADEATCCWAFDRKRWMVGYLTGHLHYTNDGGDTWAEITLPTGGGTINRVNDLSFVDSHFGFAAGKVTIGAVIYGCFWRTVNGGYDWELHLTEALTVGALGMASVHACDANKCIGAGDISAATGTIYTASGGTP